MSDYKYQYFQFPNDPEITIKTDWGYDLTEIKSTVITQSPELLVRESIYPNGFKIKFEQAPNSIVTYTNKPLVQNVDGTFSVNLFG